MEDKRAIKADFVIENENKGDILNILKDAPEYEDYTVNVVESSSCNKCKCNKNCSECETKHKYCAKS